MRYTCIDCNLYISRSSLLIYFYFATATTWCRYYNFYYGFRYHFFLQVRQDMLSGKLVCSEHQAAALASYAVQCEQISQLSVTSCGLWLLFFLHLSFFAHSFFFPFASVCACLYACVLRGFYSKGIMCNNVYNKTESSDDVLPSRYAVCLKSYYN